MAIYGEYGYRVDIGYLVAGQLCMNGLDYHPQGTSQPPTDTAPIADYFENTVFPLLLDVLANSASVVSLRVQSFRPSAGYPIFPETLRTYSFPGEVVSQSLPPYAAARIYKVPDPATEEPSAPPTPWRQGMLRIPGVPESFQNAGVMTGTEVALYQLVADSLLTMTIGSLVLQMTYTRYPTDTDPTVYAVFVDTLTASPILGTQNSRKIGY